MIKIMKKINIIVILILLISLIFSNSSKATIGDIFQNADEFLGKRKFNK